MKGSRYKIVTTSPERAVSLDVAAELTGMHPEMILEFVRAEFVHVEFGAEGSDDRPSFDESALVRLRQIEQLRHEHVNLRTVRYILQLLDQLDEAEQELRALRERLR
ncbi:MAG: hypothetical protein HKN82_16780 [Akkermansiaceae bacterium]|nr:hypothetical protein [Akkermansiaceae bacterium]